MALLFDFVFRPRAADSVLTCTNSAERTVISNADKSSAYQEIPFILQSPMILCGVHNGPSLDPLLKQTTLVRALIHHFFKIYFDVASHLLLAI